MHYRFRWKFSPSALLVWRNKKATVTNAGKHGGKKRFERFVFKFEEKKKNYSKQFTT